MSTAPNASPGPLEPHYSVKEIAERWGLSENVVRDLFRDEPGVLVIGEPRPKYGKQRGKVTLRIPQSVLERVYRRQCVVDKGGKLDSRRA